MLWLTAALSTAAYAAQGEYWETSIKMEMAGMPYAMPATTTKVCIARGSERDPGNAADKDCVITDVKHSGNKTSWKMQCNHKGEIMNGSGEMTGTPDASEGVMRMNGTSGGHKIDMTQTYKSKRLGGACDTDEMANKIKGQIAQTCDVGGKKTSDQIGMARMLLDEKNCPGKKQPFCDAVRRDSVRDANVYTTLVQLDKNANTQVASSCAINMQATTAAICKTLRADNMNALAPYCPAEAKAYRENERRRDCEGRSFTAKEGLAKCLSGEEVGDTGSEEVVAGQPRTGKARVNAASAGSAKVPVRPDNTEPGGQPKPVTAPNPADALIDGAKKLKGLFGL